LDGASFSVGYEPGDSMSGTFGGSPTAVVRCGSDEFLDYRSASATASLLWRYYGDSLTMEFPTGSGQRMNLRQAAGKLSQRVSALFLPDANGYRPVFGDSALFQEDKNFRDYVLFHEFFHGDTGKGFGSSHHTGWTGLVAKLLQQSGVPGEVVRRTN
jgi:hypothetical protein